MTRPPSTINLKCNILDGTLSTCPENFESITWTDAWNHQVVTHAAEVVRWELAGD